MAKVSIVIPHFNRFDYLKQTLASVMCQTYKDWEAIIVDDYSKLACIEQIQEFIKHDINIHLITKSNELKGAPVSRNMGFHLAKGSYVLFLDSDDVLVPFALEQRIKIFDQTKEKLQAVVAPTLVFNAIPGDLLEVWNKLNHQQDTLHRFITGDVPWHTMGTLWNKSFLSKIGGWDESLTSYQDWELHIRALLNGLLYVEIPEYDNFYRKNSDAQSIAIRYFDEDIAKGRLKAFAAVFEQLKVSSRHDLIKPFRAYVIRQLVQLIDHQKNDIVKNILDNRLAYGLKWYDLKVLTKMQTDGHTWRYRTATRYLTKLVWHNLAFDPWLNKSSNKSLEKSDIKAFSFDYQKLLNHTPNS